MFAAGSFLGPYAIEAVVGRGGMGTVYRAHDTRLLRPVALKVLEVEAELDRRREALREARAVAALQHPNIITVYDVFEAGEQLVIVMEFVAGRCLGQVLESEALSVERAVRVALEIGAALGAAHRAGIVHRDIKPSNIMLLEGDRVKVLDFGIARALASSNTAKEATTEAADPRVFGTPGYMAPEQIRGEAVGPPADVFALGVVLHQMITGRKPFHGKTTLELAAAVLRDEPATLTTSGQPVAPAVTDLVARTLRKTAADRPTLASVLTVLGAVAAERPLPSRRSFARVAPFAGAAIAVLAIVAAWWLTRTHGSSALPAPVALTQLTGATLHPTLSPDGLRVAFAWRQETGEQHIYLKTIGEDSQRRLTNGTAGESYPVWSPDGARVAFLRATDKAMNQLVVAPVTGGPEATLVTIPTRNPQISFGLSWSPDGHRFVTPRWNGRVTVLALVDADTGDVVDLTSPNASGRGDYYPVFSHDGQRIAFIRYGHNSTESLNTVALAGGEIATVFAGGWQFLKVAWTSDDRELIVAALSRPDSVPSLFRIALRPGFFGRTDPVRLDLPGQPGAVHVAGSRLVYGDRSANRTLDLMDVDLTPRPQAPPALLVSTAAEDAGPDLSRDGGRLVFESNRTGAEEIWVADGRGAGAARRTAFGLRVTGPPATGSPRWSPDGRQIAFDSIAHGTRDVFVMDTDGGEPRRLTASQAEESRPSWSADGAWIYFSSDRTGRPEIWKMPVAGGGETQVTFDGGYRAQETDDGRWLYYLPAQQGDLVRREMRNGSESVVLRGVMDGWWSVSAGGLIYSINFAADSAPPVIMRTDPVSGRAVTLRSIPGQINRSRTGMAISRDGTRAIVTTSSPPLMSLLLVSPFR